MSAYYRVDFQSANNEDLRQIFELADTAGEPVDLTGATLRMGVEAIAGLAQLEASTANGRIEIVDAEAGRFEIAIPAATIGDLPPGSYRHDLLLDRSGSFVRVWSGTLTLSQGVT
jgi:hypothetical protein